MKIKLPVLLLQLIVSLSTFSQGVWTQKANYTGAARTNIIGFAIGDKGYFAGGTFGGLSVTPECLEYNPAINSWAFKTPMPSAFRAGTGFAAGGKGYTTTGVNEAMFIQDLYEFNALGNNWNTVNPFPADVRMYASGFGIGTKGYITCGSYINITPLNDLWEYDQQANTWTQKANLPGSARHNATAFTIGNKGYIFGGTDDSNDFNDLWEYDPATNTWLQKASMPAQGRSDAVAFAIGTSAYVISGWTGGGGTGLSEVWQYNSLDNTWLQLANFPGTPANGGTAFSINGLGYVVGGYLTTQCWQYDPTPVSVWEMETPSESIMLTFTDKNPQLIFNSLKSSAIKVRIGDLSGRLILEKNLFKPAGRFSYDINVNDLKPGIYVIYVLSDGMDKVFVKKYVNL